MNARRILPALAVAGVVLGTVTPAAAHIPTVEATCDHLAVALTGYEQWKTNPAPPYNNVVRVVVDGHADQHVFEHEWSTTITWDPTVAHTWAVKVDANLHQGDPDRWDSYASGTTVPCVPATTEATTTTTPPTSSVPATSTLPTTTTATTVPPTLPATGPDEHQRDVILAIAFTFIAVGWCLNRMRAQR